MCQVCGGLFIINYGHTNAPNCWRSVFCDTSSKFVSLYKYAYKAEQQIWKHISYEALIKAPDYNRTRIKELDNIKGGFANNS